MFCVLSYYYLIGLYLCVRDFSILMTLLEIAIVGRINRELFICMCGSVCVCVQQQKYFNKSRNKHNIHQCLNASMLLNMLVWVLSVAHVYIIRNIGKCFHPFAEKKKMWCVPHIWYIEHQHSDSSRWKRSNRIIIRGTFEQKGNRINTEMK